MGTRAARIGRDRKAPYFHLHMDDAAIDKIQ
jgi:hypothetical protein